MDATEAALKNTTAVLQQALDFVTNTLTTDEQLIYSSKLLPGSTIGKHLRHAKDHFGALAESLSRPPPYTLDYDIRVRGEGMETSREAAVSTLQRTLEALNARLSPAVDGITTDTPMTLTAQTPDEQKLQTSVGRELWFVALHAVHHYAVIRVLATELGLAVDENFGVAPSTIQHRKENEARKAKI